MGLVFVSVQPVCVFLVGAFNPFTFKVVFVSFQPVCVFLVGAFNPFTFKVTVDIYVPIAIFLIVWGGFCRFFSCIS